MSIELRANPESRPDHDEPDALIQTLPPADHGIQAWKFLFGGFVVEALLWGFPLNFGVFQEYYSNLPQMKNDPNISVIGTLSSSMYFLSAPLAIPLARRLKRWEQHLVALGSLICVASLIAASFVDTVPGLIATQGFLYGTGFLLLYYPTLNMLEEWFVQRRGFAWGILCAGGGLSGMAFPFLLEVLLSKYGYRTTLRSIAVAQFCTVLLILPLMKGRLPPSTVGAFRPVKFGYLSQPLFYCFAISNLFQGFAYYIPFLYLPTFASALGLPGTTGALLLAAVNLAGTIGLVSFGYVSDRIRHILILVFVSSFGASVAAFTLWGFSQSFGSLLAFALVYGWCAGGYVVLWTRFGTLLCEDPQLVFSMMVLGKGIGNIAIGPISSRLISGPIASGYGLGRFQPLILFLGSFMLCSSLGILGWPLATRRMAQLRCST